MAIYLPGFGDGVERVGIAGGDRAGIAGNVGEVTGDFSGSSRAGIAGGFTASSRAGIAGGFSAFSRAGITGGFSVSSRTGIAGDFAGSSRADNIGESRDGIGGVTLLAEISCVGECRLNRASSLVDPGITGDAAGDWSIFVATGSLGRTRSYISPLWRSRSDSASDWSVFEVSGFGSISDITGETSSMEELFVDIDSSKSTRKI